MNTICEPFSSCIKIGEAIRFMTVELRSIILSVLLFALSNSLSGASFTGSEKTFTINIDDASTTLSVIATATGYTFTLSSGKVWTGSATGAAISGLNLTIDATGLTAYDTFTITDGAAGAVVTFNTSGANTYKDNFNINLDGDGVGGIPGIVTFNGASSFIGSNAINVVTITNILFNSASSLSTVDGNLTLDANTQLPYTTLAYNGIYISNATVKATGTGTVTAKGRSGASSGSAAHGMYMDGTGILQGGTTGTLTVQGWGSANKSAGSAHGIYLYSASATPTIISLGADVSVTGTALSASSGSCIGVSVGQDGSAGKGVITSGGNGNVTVTGYGSPGLASYNYGVLVCGPSSSITSGGAGLVKVTGFGGGTSTSAFNYGIHINLSGSTITAGAGGSVEVTGTGGTGSTGASNYGVVLTSSTITCGSGSGTVKVTGTGGGKSSSSSNSNNGVCLNGDNAVITAGGSGSVTVTGQGGTNVSGANNYGIYISNSASPYPTITSNGGDVNVSGTGGGIGGTGYNYGVIITGGTITAGSSGAVIVSGQGGNQTGTTGNYNHGIFMSAGSNVAQIASNGGNITLNGTGGGGSGSSASSSTTNNGINISGYASIKPGGNGSVSVTGKGGNNSIGGTGGSNNGVYLSGYSAGKGTMISSTNGAITVTGTGGGDGGSGTGNSGVVVELGASITSDGAGTTVGISGTGGNSSGASNNGVQVTRGTSPNFSLLTSGGGSVSVTGTGGGVGASATNYGVSCDTGGTIMAGGTGTVTIFGQGGNPSGTGNSNSGVRVYNTAATITSSGGDVSVTGTGGGASTSITNYGVDVNTSAVITAGGSGNVTITGNGGNLTGTGTNNHGVYTYASTSSITSGGGNVGIMGKEGGQNASTALSFPNGSISTATNGGSLTLAGNTINLGASTILSTKATSSLILLQRTDGVGVDLGSATISNGGPLALSSTEFGRISGGGTVNIGNANTGNINISATVTNTTGFTRMNLSSPTGQGIIAALSGTDLNIGTNILGFGSGSPLKININGTTLDTQYNQLKVTGTVDLNGAALTLAGSYTPVDGDMFTIVSATSVTGTFSGLSDGATVTFNGIPMKINYTATTVTLAAPCVNPTSGGTIASDQNGGSPFDPIAFTSTTGASGQRGTLEYKWQSSITSGSSGFSDIASSNSATYDASALSAITWYKRLARVSCKSDWTGALESNVLKVTVIAAHTVTSAAETGTGTLKNTIAAADAGDYINFDTNLMGSNTIKLTSPIVIDKNLTIQGAANGIVLDCNNATKVIEIGTVSDSPQLVVRLEKLTVTKGKDAGNVAGGILNYSELTMVNCLVVDNSATGSLLGLGAVGGIYSEGSLTLINCTIAGNAGAANDGGIGGVYCTGTLDVYNTIFYGNTGEFKSIANTPITESYNCLFEESLETLANPLYNNTLFLQGSPESYNLFGQNPKFVGSANSTFNPYLILGVSPCVDAGDNSYCSETTDIRGGSFGRNLSKTDAAVSGTIDIGAYEWKKGTDPNNIFTWTGSANTTDWNSPGNWDVGSVPTTIDIIKIPKVDKQQPVLNALAVASGGSLTIDADSEITLTGAIDNNGTIVIKSDEFQTGSLITGAAATGSGFALVERYMSLNQWHIISSPTGTQTISGFIADNIDIPYITGTDPKKYGMMDYDPVLDKWNDYFKEDNTSPLGIGKGYMVRVMAPEVHKLRFQGVINANAVTTVSKGWNCIGNPFTASIRINTAAGTPNFMVVNASAFDPSFGALYMWVQGIGYVQVNLADAATYAPVGQGFFMKVKDGVNSVSFTPAMQVHKIDAVFKGAVAPYPTIRLRAENGDKKFSTEIKFIEGTTKGLDFGYDAGLFTTDKSFSLYTKLVDDNGVNFQLQCLPPTGYDKMVIPIGIDSKAAGEIVFSVETVQLVPTCKVILEDKLTNTFTDLSKDSYKAVVVTNTTGTGRFYLHTGDIVSGLEDQVLPEKLTAYARGNKEIRVLGEVGEGAVATLFNGLGQVVLTKKLGGGNLNIIGLPNLSSGHYMLNINDKGTPQTIKIMIRK